jgi:acetyltransferase-like isoleucine patch superfamily enzyme
MFRMPIWGLYIVRRIWIKLVSFQFASCGKGLYIGKDKIIIGPRNIRIGSNFWAGDRIRLETFDCYQNEHYSPSIRIGDNVSISYDCHIGAINLVDIGDNVLIASKVYIADHSHGDVDLQSLNIPPKSRSLFSKGPVIIEECVWIGEAVTILPNVRIGRNSVIGANAVVTKDIPPFSVAVGNPAKIIKTVLPEQ